MATCPECEFDEIDTEDLEEGDRLSCPECGKSLVMVGSDELDLVRIVEMDRDSGEGTKVHTRLAVDDPGRADNIGLRGDGTG